MESNTQQQPSTSHATAPNNDVKDAAAARPPSPTLSVLAGFHAGYFRITLSLSSQALLWKTLTTDDNPSSVSPASPVRLAASRILPSTAFVLLWSVSLAFLVSFSLLYTLRCLLRSRSVRAEFSHRVGASYLFAPWISWLLILQSSPFLLPNHLLFPLWCLFSVPMVALDVKIYGQWFTKGKRFLSMVANPTSQMSVIGSMAAARAAAGMGWREAALFMFSLGIAHYLVLFVTLYQRLSGSGRLPAALRPVFFLFLAAPSMGSLAWRSISGRFDVGSKMLFFLSLFLFACLVTRPAFFRRSMRKFSVAWWAYPFPLTVMALSSMEYAQEVKGGVPNGIMLVFSVISVVVSLILMVCTAFNTGAILPRDDPFAPIPSIVLPCTGTSAGSNGIISVRIV